ncbi:hypothetical protein M011DRAFT_456608 [Sporormia fimetaria CBS 119925]|uniref:Uncharacterized protein n=1 Tax=Sporormia fimetaria CBS 119925 TaxID=1340428 RepID=A0A6A6VGY5_9PLEO|nr:hypothetical protein M011DRAFT_456608 [Sporormia fimetaria CBS 119925]
MSKRHNRKRTRSRPRHRSNISNHSRSFSFESDSSFQPNAFISPHATTHASTYLPLANRPADHWDQMYEAWQTRDQLRRQQEEALEAHRLRVFGGEADDELSLLEPMLRVVTNLFDGKDDYEDP